MALKERYRPARTSRSDGIMIFMGLLDDFYSQLKLRCHSLSELPRHCFPPIGASLSGVSALTIRLILLPGRRLLDGK